MILSVKYCIIYAIEILILTIIIIKDINNHEGYTFS